MMKYHGAPLYYTDLLSDCNLVFTILFTIECVMKVGCFGPKVRMNICGWPASCFCLCSAT